MYIMSNRCIKRVATASRFILLCFFLNASLLPCLQAATVEDRISRFYEDALARFNRKDYAGAEIQTKNVLQTNPRYLPAQVLLGRIQLQLGKSADAERSFKTAMQLGVDRSEVATVLGEAYFNQDKYAAVTEIDPAGLPPKAKVEILVLRAYSYLELGNLANAQTALGEARRVEPNSAAIAQAQAVVFLRQNKPAEAKKFIDYALALSPENAKTWNLKATITHALGDASNAFKEYGRAIQLDPAYSEPRIARAALLVDLGRDKEALEDLDQIKGRAANDPRRGYLRAVIYAKQRNSTRVQQSLDEVIRSVDAIPSDVLNRHPQLLLIGGMAHYSLDHREKAQQYLQRFLILDPKHMGVRKVLASILLTERNFVKAIDVLQPVRAAMPNDTYTLSLLTTAYLGLNQRDTAEKLMEQAVISSQSSPAMESSLGFTMLSSGDVDNGIARLRQAFETDQDQVQAGMAVAILELKRNQPKAALSVANKLVQKQPDNALYQNLLGAIHGALGNIAASRAAYEKAAAINPAYTAPQLNLARIDMTRGKLEAAQTRLTALLKRDPKNVQVLFELARAQNAAGRFAEATRDLEKARALAPRNMEIAGALMDVYLARKSWDKVIQLAGALESDASGSYNGLGALGRAYLGLGEYKKAASTFDRMATAAGNNPVFLTEIARLQIAANNFTGARALLMQAIAINPNFLPAQAQLTALDLSQGDRAKAESRVKDLSLRFPGDSIVLELQGDIAHAKNSFTEAITAYRAAYTKRPDSNTLIRLARAQFKAGNVPAAIATLEQGIKTHNQDEWVRRALAETQMRAGMNQAARLSYEGLLKANPNDVGALNNLATLLNQAKDPNALSYIERAYRVAPENAAVNDTYGWILATQDQASKALLYLREARLRDPQNGEIRYHLGYVLHRLNRKEEARSELAAALEMPPFPEQGQARALLVGLNN